MVDLLKKIACIGFLCCIGLSCDPFNPTDTAAGNASLSLSLEMATTQKPEQVYISIDAGSRQVNGNTDFTNRTLSFSGLPLGDACITIDAVSGNSIKILDGHTTVNLRAGANRAEVPLNNVLLSYYINPLMADSFLKNATDKSSLWTNNYLKSFASLTNGTTPTAVEVRSAHSDNGYYFLFEVRNDPEFRSGMTDNRTPAGEWLNDACIIYLSTAMSADMPDFGAPDKRSFVRIQCMIGFTPPANGNLEITEFENGVQKSNDLRTLNTINFARVIQAGPVRIFEIFIDDNFLKILGEPGERVAMVLRYIDNRSSVPYEILDWKNQKSDPKNTLDTWGNIELQPK